MPPIGYPLMFAYSPPTLTTNIGLETQSLLEDASYDREVRALGLNEARVEALSRSARSFADMRKYLLSDLATLQHEVERAPAPGTGLWPEAMSWQLVAASQSKLVARRPVDKDFERRRAYVPEHERYKEPALKAGDLEFKP